MSRSRSVTSAWWLRGIGMRKRRVYHASYPSARTSPCMSPEKPSAFVKVDELMSQVSLEQVAAYYGIRLPELHRVGSETRSRCFLLCGRAGETGDRVLAMQESDPARRWHCHQYGCGQGGNLLSLIDFLKPGESGSGRPRGQRFKEIAA